MCLKAGFLDGYDKRLNRHLLAVFLCVLRPICAIEELPLEKLHCDDGKDEHEELVDNEDVEDVLEGVHHTVKHCLQRRPRREYRYNGK